MSGNVLCSGDSVVKKSKYHSLYGIYTLVRRQQINKQDMWNVR